MFKRGYTPLLRLFLWLALLFAVGLAVQSVVLARHTRARGLPADFPAPVSGADVPLLGVNVALEQYADAEFDAALARVAAGGFAWVRQSFYRSQVEPGPGQFDWRAPDRIVTALARYPQLRLVAVLDDVPPAPPGDPDRFAAFAAEFAARYGAQVDDYQVWDEPNLAAHWGGGPVNPPAYADLLARTARAIRTADPGSRILLAGLAPTVETGPQNLSDVRYLERLYQAGAAPYFDVVVGKPYGFYTPPGDRRAQEALLNFSRLFLLREVVVARGDADKAIWASHWGWNALPPGWQGAPSAWGQTDEATQAQWTVAALERARTEWPWVGAMMLDHWQPAVPRDDAHWGFALLGPDGAPRPVYDAVSAWAAALPDAAPVGGYLASNRWATYAGDWRVGPLGADVGRDGDRATFRFDGPSVALTLRRGPYRAFLYVTVDGAPANGLPRDEAGRAYAVLYDAEHDVATVPLATGLAPGPHSVEIVAQGGQGQWALVDWRVGPGPVRDSFGPQVTGLAAAGLALAALLVRDARRVDWGRLKQALLGWPAGVQVALLAGLVGAFWATAAASWGRGLDACLASPCFSCSLLLLPVLAALFALRLDLGLAAVACTAPFYLHPGTMLYRALSLPEVLVLLCGVALLLTYPRRAGTRRRRTRPLDWAVLALALAALVAGLAAADRAAAFFELRTVFIFPLLYYLLLRQARLDERGRRYVLDALVLGAVAVALVGLVQYLLGRNVVIAEGGLPRLRSVYHSPNSVGLYLGRVWPLVLALGLWGARGRRRVFYGLALALLTLALVLSFSRGALLLGIPAALLVMGWGAGGRYRWAALALVALGTLALIPLLRLPRFASLLDLQQGSTFFRLELWRSSLALIRDHPWFGVGPGNFVVAYRTRYVLPAAWEEFNLAHPHNVYLDHWTRLGVLGLLAGIAIQVAFFKQHLIAKKSRVPWLTDKTPTTREENGNRTQKNAEKRRFYLFPGVHQRELAFVRVLPRFITQSVCLPDAATSLGLMGSMAALLAHGLVDNTLFFPDLALAFFLLLGLSQGDTDPG